MQDKYEITIKDFSRFADLISLKSFIESENSIIITLLYYKIPSDQSNSDCDLLTESIFSSLKQSSIQSLNILFSITGLDLQILKTEGTEESCTIRPGDYINRLWLVKSSVPFAALCIEGEFKGQTLNPVQLSPCEFSLSFELMPSVVSIPSIYTIAFKAYTAEGSAFGPELRMSVIIH